MGQGPSKPPPSSTQHVFTSETPVRFSQELIDSLQASPETDSTRAKDLELHIQSRVASELSRLEAEQSRDLSERLASDPPSTHPSLQQNQSQSFGGPDLKARVEDDRLRDLGRESVQQEIETLRKKLGERKVREIDADREVKKAKEEVVRCLRVHDRRPLDCWKEVEAFKTQVGRLEKAFVERVVG